MATRKTPQRNSSKAGTRIAEIAPAAGRNPPAAPPPDAQQMAALLQVLVAKRAGPTFASETPILLTGVPDHVVEALAVASPDGLSAATALRILTLSPAASVVLGVPADKARALAGASAPGILPRDTFETLVKLSPPVQALDGLSARTALLLAAISPDGISERTLQTLRGLEPAARNLRSRKESGG